MVVSCTEIMVIPEGFFDSSDRNRNMSNLNVERFALNIIGSVCNVNELRSGDALKKEPDWIINGIPVEVTLAASNIGDSNETLIQEICNGSYYSDDVEKDICELILKAAKKKAEKKYSIDNVHLCIVSPIEISSWILDYYCSYTQLLSDYRREDLFQELSHDYIITGCFSDILIIFPDGFTNWWVWVVGINLRVPIFSSKRI